jgi:plastocyanin
LRHLLRKGGIAAVAAGIILTLPLAASANPSEIYMSDACSPSFNVALNDPTICNRQGGTPFDVFVQQLMQNKFAGAWRFSAPQVQLSAGDTLTVDNRGGETHTFTQVTQFGGGGIVADLNLILFGTATPPTFFFGPFNFVAAGDETTISASTLTPGTHLFICAIHPWMEETVVVL